MRLYWLQTLLLAAVISLPLDGLAAPCLQKRCPTQSLVTRGAEAGIIPILPIPRPIIPAIRPWPIAPKPITPKPITPKPALPPKPLEPAQPNLGSGPRCRRAPGDTCSNITPFSDAEFEAARTKGRDTQASLLETQKANPAAQDVERAAVSTKYDHVDDPESKPPMDGEEIEFLYQSHLQVSYTTNPEWTYSITRNKEGVNPSLENNILETSTSRKDKGMVIIDSRNKENDLAPAEEKAPWSDMVMFDLKNAFKNSDVTPNDLQYMIRSNIGGGGTSASKTKRYIEAAIERTKGDDTRVNTFRSDPDTPGILPDEIAAYQLLAGSDHVHRVLLMLKDYPSTMKNVRVESLSVTTPATQGADDAYNIIIKFTKLENP